MAIIADILTQVDAAATAVGATAFDAVAAEIVPVFRIGSVLVVALGVVKMCWKNSCIDGEEDLGGSCCCCCDGCLHD